MGNSSSDYNKKVESFSSALHGIQRQARYKGFLGPSVRDDDKMPSVGTRAARAAGVIVDDLGKLRCPPGTPNANQFTDLQMSNCMVPGAEAVQDAARSVANAVRELPNAAPEKSNRPDKLFQATVNPARYEQVGQEMKASLLRKYLPDGKSDRPMREVADELVKNMGLMNTRDFETQLYEGVELFRANAPSFLTSLRTRLDKTEDPQERARTNILISSIEESLVKMETPQGTEELKTQMAENMLEILAAHESTLERFPRLRGRQTIEIQSREMQGNAGSAAFASTRVDNKGRVMTLAYYHPQALVAGVFDTDDEAGDIFKATVRVAGVDSYQMETAVHESGHNVHFAALLERFGIDVGSDKPIAEQLQANGDSLDSSHIGTLYAMSTGIPLDSKVSELSEKDKKQLADFALTHTRNTLDRVPADSLDNPNSLLRKSSGVLPIFPSNNQTGKIIADALKNQKGINSSVFDNVPEGMDSIEGIDGFVKSKTGMTSKELLDELHESLSADIGVDAHHASTGGFSPDEIMSVMGSMSDYAATQPAEAIAEAFAMDALVSRVGDAKIGDENELRLVRSMLAKITREGEEFKGVPKVSDRTKAAYSSLQKVLSAPELSKITLAESEDIA